MHTHTMYMYEPAHHKLCCDEHAFNCSDCYKKLQQVVKTNSSQVVSPKPSGTAVLQIKDMKLATCNNTASTCTDHDCTVYTHTT